MWPDLSEVVLGIRVLPALRRAASLKLSLGLVIAVEGTNDIGVKSISLWVSVLNDLSSYLILVPSVWLS
jgi:hypothetical protein